MTKKLKQRDLQGIDNSPGIRVTSSDATTNRSWSITILGQEPPVARRSHMALMDKQPSKEALETAHEWNITNGCLLGSAQEWWLARLLDSEREKARAEGIEIGKGLCKENETK